MPFNPAEFLVHVDDLDVSEDRKIEMIRVVAAIMQSFVERAFVQSPEQILLGTGREKGGAESRHEVRLGNSITSFNVAGSEGSTGKSPP